MFVQCLTNLLLTEYHIFPNITTEHFENFGKLNRFLQVHSHIGDIPNVDTYIPIVIDAITQLGAWSNIPFINSSIQSGSPFMHSINKNRKLYQQLENNSIYLKDEEIVLTNNDPKRFLMTHISPFVGVFIMRNKKEKAAMMKITKDDLCFGPKVLIEKIGKVVENFNPGETITSFYAGGNYLKQALIKSGIEYYVKNCVYYNNKFDENETALLGFDSMNGFVFAISNVKMANGSSEIPFASLMD
ncbi:hypothetical protein TRFO_14170 [Tritrichomonas foetus]|uniref:Uncharacterized protein n=1 Tax=Tritrichomonas foetus TaxID=1144522 RepID=A0A1J4KW80_9EUKA|nr:hypothetical protein TRFO_14170 [Tritrichomonas foetus]|eukprot:OHT15402.1 hypothetical protein TRFO_14170 [Tritrichomonas foetus]